MGLTNADREFVASVRERRRSVCLQIANAQMTVRQAAHLARTDEQVRDLYAVKVLDVHPVLGKVAGRRLLISVGAHQFSTLASLDDNMIERIEQAIQSKPA